MLQAARYNLHGCQRLWLGKIGMQLDLVDIGLTLTVSQKFART